MPRPAVRRVNPSLRLTLRADVASGKAYLPFLRKHLRAAHEMLRPPLRELSVALVGDKRMSDLHVQFMGIGGPTDVLTFPLDEEAGGVTEGEVVVCVPEARRRAADHRTRLERELLLYALHGLLHLCGYDDRTPRAYTKMHRTEDQILSRLGVGPVFTPTLGASTSRPSAPPRRVKAATRARGGRGRAR
jgi:probable rRNA maturation factor